MPIGEVVWGEQVVGVIPLRVMEREGVIDLLIVVLGLALMVGVPLVLLVALGQNGNL